ncbi:hypothetical protein HRD49_22520, partial [Corallococcus exiguus]|nr:hypothetical protein [Corallococcus exiguus]
MQAVTKWGALLVVLWLGLGGCSDAGRPGAGVSQKQSSRAQALAAGQARLLRDIHAGTAGTTYGKSGGEGLRVGRTLFYVASDLSNGGELWKSDGTPEGTVLVKDIRPGPNSSNLAYFVEMDGILYFSATDHSGAELWRSDGTPEGTWRVKDIAPGPDSGGPSFLSRVGHQLFFIRTSELWKSDGTEAGTVLVRSFEGSIYDTIGEPTVSGGTLFFSANEPGYGWELWKSDGTPEGTVLVKDIQPGEGHSQPTNLRDVKGTLFFTADDGVHGNELWKSDGTPGGTVLITDARPGVGGLFIYDP